MDTEADIYRKKTIDAALNSILTKITELNGANDSDKEIMQRRWIWELMQNAKDCENTGGIIITIELNEAELLFSHNGKVFTHSDLLDLITQISSKRTDEDKKIGKYGTGFMSTHLISKMIMINGIFHKYKDSNNYKAMSCMLDRSGIGEEAIRESILNAIQQAEMTNQSQDIAPPSNLDMITTSFKYILPTPECLEVKDAINYGYNALNSLIPFVFVFSKTIKEVNWNGVKYIFDRTPKILTDGLEIFSITKVDNDQTKTINVLVCTDIENGVSIATLIECNEGQYSILSSSNMPKLFCTFPLVGTEKFSFPIILNSPNFEVRQERNGILEGSTINDGIFSTAILLYQKMLNYISCQNWNNLYHLCGIYNEHASSLEKKILNKIVNIYKILPLVDTLDKDQNLVKESLYRMNGMQEESNIIIPYMSTNELTDELWELLNKINFSVKLPTKETYKYWSKISPSNKVTLKDLYDQFLTIGGQLSSIDDLLLDKAIKFTWLNNLYDLRIRSMGNQEFRLQAIVPNQKDEFIEINKLKKDNGIDDVLKEILTSLGNDIKKQLLHKEIVLLESIQLESYNNKDIANFISELIRKQLYLENAGTTNREHAIQSSFNTLTVWFEKNKEEAKALFNDTYDRRHLLSNNEETLRRLEFADTVESTMNKYGINQEQINILLDNSALLLNMLETGEQSLSKEVLQSFQHSSSKSIYAKEKIELLIDRSISNVYDYLNKSSKYTVDSSLELWKANQYSKTVFQANRDDRVLRIVIRPSDDEKIIFYEDAEIEALDDNRYELWTDDGKGFIREITLRDIIKTTGLTAIPLKKLSNNLV